MTKDGIAENLKAKDSSFVQKDGSLFDFVAKDGVGSIKPIHEASTTTARGVKEASASVTKEANEESIRSKYNTKEETWSSGSSSKSSIWDRTKARSATLFGSAKKATALALSSAATATGFALRLGVDRAAKGARSTLAAARERVFDTIKHAFRTATAGIRTTTAGMRDATASWLRAVLVQPVQSVWTNIIRQTWHQSVPVVWNRFWWWSLAAIGVYGIATTVPKEIVKQVLLVLQTTPSSSNTSSKVEKKEDVA